MDEELNVSFRTGNEETFKAGFDDETEEWTSALHPGTLNLTVDKDKKIGKIFFDNSELRVNIVPDIVDCGIWEQATGISQRNRYVLPGTARVYTGTNGANKLVSKLETGDRMLTAESADPVFITNITPLLDGEFEIETVSSKYMNFDITKEEVQYVQSNSTDKESADQDER